MQVSDNPQTHEDKTGPVRSLTCARLRDWVRSAQPGARLTYGQGANASLCCTAELRDLVWDLAQKGYLTPHTVRLGRDDYGRSVKVQIVQRTARPVLKGAVL